MRIRNVTAAWATISLLLSATISPSSILTPDRPLTILFPPQGKLLVSTGAASISGNIDLSRVAVVELLESAEMNKRIEVSTKEQKENFAKHVRAMFPDNIIAGHIAVRFSHVRTGEQRKEYRFSLNEEVDLRKFWNSTAFREILALAYDQRVLDAQVVLSGWLKRTTVVSSIEHQQRFGNHFFYSVSLSPGMNIFYLQAKAANGKPVAFDSVAFFYKTAVQSDSPPSDFVHLAFHQEAFEGPCTTCHALSLPTSVMENKSSVEAECRSCHSGLVSRKSVHVPAETWDCLMCHDPQSTPKYQLYAEKQVDAALCYECHADKQESIQSKPSVHAVAEECRTCHDVHGSQQDALVVDQVNTVCSSCHPDVATTPHPVVEHPLKGRPDPLRPGKELSCVTCHNPHASDHPRLLTAPQFTLCQQCHKK